MGRDKFFEAVEQFARLLFNHEQGSMFRLEKILFDYVIEKLDETLVIAVHVQKTAGFTMKTQLRPT